MHIDLQPAIYFIIKMKLIVKNHFEDYYELYYQLH